MTWRVNMAYKFELDKINYVAIAQMAHNINKAVLEAQGYLSKRCV